HDGDLLPRGQRLADGIQHGLDRVAGGFLRQARLFGDPRNKLRFVHRTFLLWEVFRTRYFGDTFRIPPFGMLSIGDFTSLHTRKCTNSSGSAAARRRGPGTGRRIRWTAQERGGSRSEERRVGKEGRCAWARQ